MSGELEEGEKVDFNPHNSYSRTRRGTVTGIWKTPGGHIRYGVQWTPIPASAGLRGTQGFYGTYTIHQLSKVVE